MDAKATITHGATATVASVAPAFIQDSLSHMVPWLIATAAVIACDLAFGIRKSLLMQEDIRFSKAVRRTMGKMVTYFAFVCMVCMVEVAAGSQFGIDRWACLLVCFIEFCSVVSNILAPKGYAFNLKKFLVLLAGKALRESKEELEDVIEKTGGGNHGQ